MLGNSSNFALITLPLIDEIKAKGIEIIYLEDMKTDLTIFDKIVGVLAMLFPKTIYKWTKM